MGLPKAALPFGPELMLPRVVRLLREVVEPVVVVAAVGQELPELPAEVMIARDQREGRGPLQGLHDGLTAIEAHADAAFASGCDVPLLRPEFVQQMIRELDGHDVAVPVEDGFHHPLASAYRVSVLPSIKTLLAEDQLRPRALFESVDTNRVDVESLKTVDPHLATLRNLNRAADYFEALEIAGFEAPADVIERLSDG